MKLLHATQIATRGIIGGSTIGLTTAGFLVEIEEIVLPERPPGGYGGGSFRFPVGPKRERKEQKQVKIKVYYSGQTYEHMEIMDAHYRVSVKDVEVITDDDDRVISVSIKNVRKS